MLKEAREFLGNGVVACDLAGDEKAYPTAAFADVFATAKKIWHAIYHPCRRMWKQGRNPYGH